MSYTATTWRWPDSTFGKQKNTPFSDDQFYPDCGTQRIYTLEDILYGLENVVTPLLQAIAGTSAKIQDLSGKLTLTNAYQDLKANTACTKVTFWLLSTASESATIKVNGGGEIVLEPGYSLTVNVANTDDISIKQATGGDVVYFTYTTAI